MKITIGDSWVDNNGVLHLVLLGPPGTAAVASLPLSSNQVHWTDTGTGEDINFSDIVEERKL